MRSAMPPEMMVAAVAAKTDWKNQKVRSHWPASLVGSTPVRPKLEPPMKPPMSEPNMMPKPSRKKAGCPAAKSRRFFMRMLPAFLAREKPISTRAKPGCMNMTRMAAISIQSRLALDCDRASPSAKAMVGVAVARSRVSAQTFGLNRVVVSLVPSYMLSSVVVMVDTHAKHGGCHFVYHVDFMCFSLPLAIFSCAICKIAGSFILYFHH